MPYFKFNSLSGRLAPSNPQQAYTPSGLQNTVPETAFQFDSIKTKAVTMESSAVAADAALSSAKGGFYPSATGYQRILNAQKAMLANDGLLVWQKMGARDRGPLVLTFALIAVGLSFGLSNLWTMSWPKKVQD